MCVRSPVGVLLVGQTLEVLLRLAILFILLHVFNDLEFTAIRFTRIVELLPVDVKVDIDESLVDEELVFCDLTLILARRVLESDPFGGVPGISLLRFALPASPTFILILHRKVLLVISSTISCLRVLFRLLVH